MLKKFFYFKNLSSSQRVFKMASVCRRRFSLWSTALGRHPFVDPMEPWEAPWVNHSQKSQRQGEIHQRGLVSYGRELPGFVWWAAVEGEESLLWGRVFLFLVLVERSLGYNIMLVSGVWWFDMCTHYEMIIVMSLVAICSRPHTKVLQYHCRHSSCFTSLVYLMKQKQMFFWNSLAFSMIQWILAIWSLVPLPFRNLAYEFGSSRFVYFWSLALRILRLLS